MNKELAERLAQWADKRGVSFEDACSAYEDIYDAFLHNHDRGPTDDEVMTIFEGICS